MRRSSLPLKLRAAFFLPTLAAFAISSPLAWLLLTDLLESTTAKQLSATLPMIEPVLLEALAEDPVETQTRVSELGRSTSLRITLIGHDGVVLADSDRTLEQLRRMDNHRYRPEVVEAYAGGEGSSTRHSATTGLDFVYAARMSQDLEGRPLVLRLAQPLDELTSLRRRMARIVLLAAAAALATLGALIWLYNRRLSAPAGELIDGVRRLEKGDFSVRVAPPGERELVPAARFINRIATQARGRVEDLEADIERLRSLIDGIRDGVLVTDDEGFIWLTNPAFKEIFGISDDVEGRTPLELTRDTRLEDLIVRTLSEAAPQSEQVEIHLPRPRHVALASTYLEDGSGAVILARDVTALVRLTRMRQDFVANVSHELKTPLSAIRGYAETLVDGAVEDERTRERFLRQILHQGRRLQALLEDLLTLSHLESLERQSEVRPVDLRQVVRECLEMVSHGITEKGIELEIDSEDDLPRVSGDGEALERMTLNLLNNAVKYNTHGGRVSVRLRREGNGVLLEVTDTGIGIPAASLPRVFERFYRVDKARSREEGGTGLGLAIVKHAAQLHGGTVDVQSRIGEGSTFRIWLPSERPS